VRLAVQSHSDLSQLAPANRFADAGEVGCCPFSDSLEAGDGTERNGAQFFGRARACGPVRRRKLGEAGERVCASKFALRVRVQVQCEQPASAVFDHLPVVARVRKARAPMTGRDVCPTDFSHPCHGRHSRNQAGRGRVDRLSTVSWREIRVSEQALKVLQQPALWHQSGEGQAPTAARNLRSSALNSAGRSNW
jgi:hypothetical protein